MNQFYLMVTLLLEPIVTSSLEVEAPPDPVPFSPNNVFPDVAVMVGSSQNDDT